MEPKLRAWIVFPGGTKFGEGRAALLRLVEEEGSLNRAVARMGMSYRAAWGYLRELERAAGFEFLARAPGGRRAGTGLTPRGRRFLDAYEAYDRRLESCAARAFRDCFRIRSRPARARRRRP